MKFEKPIMNISIFNLENVATESSVPQTNNFAAANAEADEMVKDKLNAVKVTVNFTF